MARKRAVHLTFAANHAQLREALSGAVQIDQTLWVVNDETASLERFTHQGNDGDAHPQYGHHTRFAVKDYIPLPIPPQADEEGEEVDMEGLAYADGYLWLAGSHSLSRNKPDTDDPLEKAFQQLAELKRGGNRYLLARIPLVADDAGIHTPQVSVEQADTTLTAARLHGDASGNELMAALRCDPHLSPFLDLPGKDNGLDIEGLAAIGRRVFLGLRGPVLRGWAVILELEPVADPDDPTLLRLAAIGGQGQPYRKHFLKLNGLGVRDLCVLGGDLLILAGPTMSLDGPMTVYRWKGGANPAGESLVENDSLRAIRRIPVGPEDHAEGIALFPLADGKPGLLVVYDPASPKRLPDKKTVIADLFPL